MSHPNEQKQEVAATSSLQMKIMQYNQTLDLITTWLIGISKCGSSILQSTISYAVGYKYIL
jgi:hypothetical protein